MSEDAIAEDESAPKNVPPKSIVGRILAGVLFGVVVYGVIVVVGGARQIAVELEHFHYLALALACSLAFANYLLRFGKWEYYLAVLGVRGIPKAESLLIFLSGFVLTITPGKVGEVFKSYVLYQRHGVPMVRTAPIVVAERLTDLIGIIFLITVGGSTFRGGLWWALAGALVVGTILVLVSVPSVMTAILARSARLPVGGSFFERFAVRIEHALTELRMLTRPRHLVLPTLLSIVGWSLEGVAVYVILRGFSADPDLLQTIFFYGTATLAGALVPVPGGLGVTDKVLEQSMVTIGGIPHGLATAAMLLGRLATLWFAVLVGFIALGLLRLRGSPR